jgi:hypothetical protein
VDLTNDGVPEIVFTTYGQDASPTTTDYLIVLTNTGTELLGTPAWPCILLLCDLLIVFVCQLVYLPSLWTDLKSYSRFHVPCSPSYEQRQQRQLSRLHGNHSR